MSQLAIKGYLTRGEEVLGILKMLGGENLSDYNGESKTMCYYINKRGYIECDKEEEVPSPVQIFTLEEFLKKFPYKVGDKVRTIYERIGIINKPIWSNRDNCIRYELEADTDSFYSVNELQPYKEETMEKEISGAIVDRFICLEGYDFYDDKGNIINTKEITMKKKQPEYPKTYEECCKVLQMPKDESYIDIDVPLSYNKVLKVFTQLLICRDAYWKIVCDEIGLGEPWKPDWEDTSQSKHSIWFNNEGICLKSNRVSYEVRHILTFPTKDMRDAFYENFKELIEECKELL